MERRHATDMGYFIQHHGILITSKTSYVPEQTSLKPVPNNSGSASIFTRCS
jgi:hypothetical protein